MFISYILALLLSVALTKIYLLDEKTQKELKGLIIFKRLYTGFNPNRSIDRGVVLLSKNKSFPTAIDHFGLNFVNPYVSSK